MKKILIALGSLIALVLIIALGVFMLKSINPKEKDAREGLRESLAMEYGTVIRTAQLKDLPEVTWVAEDKDPNLRFPVDFKGNVILGKDEENPPQFVDAEPGYRWTKVEASNAPAKWVGAAKDTNRLFGIVPAVIAGK